jgi:YVTN family beta-propeller protein
MSTTTTILYQTPIVSLIVDLIMQYQIAREQLQTEYGLSEQSSSSSSRTTAESPRSGIGVDTYPIGISLNPSTKKIYVANEFSNTVSVVDIPALKVEATISVENFPYAIDSFVT